MSESQKRATQQYNIFQQNTGVAPPTTSTYGLGNDPVQSNQKFTSFVNSEFKYNPTATTTCKSDTGICIASFCKTCSPSSLIRGNYCEHHNQVFFQRSFANSPLENGMETVPVPFKRANYRPLMMLTSMMPINYTIAQIESAMLHTSGWSSDEKTLIVRFFAILALNINELKNSQHTTVFKAYINELVLQCQIALIDNLVTINQLLIPVLITDDYMERIRSNAWSENLVNPVDTGTDGVKLYLVPLIAFNMLDIAVILSYQLELVREGVGFAPNCKIVDGQYVHGIGAGLNNAIENYKNIQTDPGFNDYSDKINQLLAKDAYIFNLDIEVMLAVPTNNNTIVEKIKKTVLLQTQPKHTFDIRRITSHNIKIMN